jgi:hypothetical protein
MFFGFCRPWLRPANLREFTHNEPAAQEYTSLGGPAHRTPRPSTSCLLLLNSEPESACRLAVFVRCRRPNRPQCKAPPNPGASRHPRPNDRPSSSRRFPRR